jgi:hypothetical protein
MRARLDQGEWIKLRMPEWDRSLWRPRTTGKSESEEPSRSRTLRFSKSMIDLSPA